MNEEIVVILDANPSMGDEINAGHFAEIDEDDDDCKTDPIFRSDDTTQKKDVNTRGGWQKNREDNRIASEDFLGTTKFDVARYIVQELLLHTAASCHSLEDQTRVLALVTLGGIHHDIIEIHQNRNDFTGMKRKRSRLSLERPEDTDEATSWNTNSDSDGGCCCYYSNENDDESSMGWFETKVRTMNVSPPLSSSQSESPGDGDFVTGIVRATDAMLKSTTVGASRRRILLVTDARHKVLEQKKSVPTTEDPLEKLVKAINRLRAIGCTLEVIGMGFRREKFEGRDDEAGSDNGKKMNRPEIINGIANSKVESELKDESDGEALESDENSSNDDEDDWSDVQDQNELLVIDLVEKLGGCVQAVNGGTSDDYYCVKTVLKRLELASKKSSTKTRTKELSSSDLPSKIDVDKEINVNNHCMDNTKVGSIIENRDASSLRPTQDTSILYWNGNDDVLLPEWIKIAKPSRWSGERGGGDGNMSNHCCWIQIDDPLRPEDGIPRLQKEDLSRYPKSLEENFFAKAKDEAENGSQSSKQPESLFQAILELVKADGYDVPGNWLVCCDLEDADALWEKIAVGTAYGKLGPTSRVSPTKDMLHTQRGGVEPSRSTSPIIQNWKHNYSENSNDRKTVIICVGVKDSTDRAHIKRVFGVLNKHLKIPSGLLAFQPCVFADPAAYGSNRWQFPKCSYTAEEVLSW